MNQVQDRKALVEFLEDALAQAPRTRFRRSSIKS